MFNKFLVVYKRKNCLPAVFYILERKHTAWKISILWKFPGKLHWWIQHWLNVQVISLSLMLLVRAALSSLNYTGSKEQWMTFWQQPPPPSFPIINSTSSLSFQVSVPWAMGLTATEKLKVKGYLVRTVCNYWSQSYLYFLMLCEKWLFCSSTLE